MSVDQGDRTSHEEDNDPVSEVPPKVSHKSFRRKYRKIMVKFEEKMRESNTLFKEEQRILDISRRLSKQNDQILELLYDLNHFPQIPSRLRYDLRPPESGAKGLQSRLQDNSPRIYTSATASAALREGKRQLSNGEISLSDYQELFSAILTSPDFAPTKSFTSLLKVPPSASASNYDQESREQSSGFPSSQQEEQYLRNLDAYLSDPSTSSHNLANGKAFKNIDRATDRDRDMALQNPVSVYNWLRKHQPQVFLQDNELNSERQSRNSTSRASKRVSTQIKQEDLYDEDGIAVEVGTSMRGKRKREEDTGYRPKGGNSRPAKRKKEEGFSIKKSKRQLSAGAGVT